MIGCRDPQSFNYQYQVGRYGNKNLRLSYSKSEKFHDFPLLRPVPAEFFFNYFCCIQF